jgi:Flp pilus assembly protein TadD
VIETIKGLGNQSIDAMQRQDWKAAANFLQEAITLCGHCPLLGDLHKDLGLNACHSGDLDTGQRELREALRLKPADSDIVIALQWIEQQRANSGTLAH